MSDAKPNVDTGRETEPAAKRRILEAASRLFLSGGLRALSVRAIAKEAGLSTIGIYSHFHGKEGVLEALYIEGFERVAAMLADAPAAGAPEEIAQETMRRYLALAERYEAHYRLIFGEDGAGYAPSPAAQDAAAAAFRALVALAGRITPPEAGAAAQKRAQQRAALQLWALAHGFAGLRRHAIASHIDPSDWAPIIEDAVNRQISAITQAGGAAPDPTEPEAAAPARPRRRRSRSS